MKTVKGYDADSIDWRGINPDGTPDEQMLAEVTVAIVEAVGPERIILFGSAARGEMRAKSDLDVLVVKEGDHVELVPRRQPDLHRLRRRNSVSPTAPRAARRRIYSPGLATDPLPGPGQYPETPTRAAR